MTNNQLKKLADSYGLSLEYVTSWAPPTTNKRCPKCGEYKALQDYTVDRSCKDGLACWCRECQKKKHRQYREKNKEKIYLAKKEYREKNKEYIAQKKRDWYRANKEHVREKKRVYYKEHYDNDAIYKMKKNCHSIATRAFRKKMYSMKDDANSSLLGCSTEYFQEYLKNTWEKRYGSEWNGEPYNIDHKIPLCTANSINDVRKLFHYTNLQLLTPEDNAVKGVKYDA